MGYLHFPKNEGQPNAMKIEAEIRQEKFQNNLQKAQVNILFTASWLSLRQKGLLMPFGISPQQFNVLRIVRGFRRPMCIRELTSRMLDKSSNASRLVVKLIDKGLVTKETNPADHRFSAIWLTEAGLDLLEKASEVIAKDTAQAGNFLTEAEAGMLSDLLDKLRG
jgi:DNA-binding MarR family transcriptional regulator